MDSSLRAEKVSHFSESGEHKTVDQINTLIVLFDCIDY